MALNLAGASSTSRDAASRIDSDLELICYGCDLAVGAGWVLGG